MVSQSAQSGDDGRLLATAGGGCADEDAGILAPVAARLPLLTGGVPEGFPLRREVTVTGRDAEEEAVVLL